MTPVTGIVRGMPNDDAEPLNADQILLLAGAFEELAKICLEATKQAALKDPADIAADMIKKAIDAKDDDAYSLAIRLFEAIKKARESALMG